MNEMKRLSVQFAEGLGANLNNFIELSALNRELKIAKRNKWLEMVLYGDSSNLMLNIMLQEKDETCSHFKSTSFTREV